MSLGRDTSSPIFYIAPKPNPYEYDPFNGVGNNMIIVIPKTFLASVINILIVVLVNGNSISVKKRAYLP
jgi:hypothetical protein